MLKYPLETQLPLDLKYELNILYNNFINRRFANNRRIENRICDHSSHIKSPILNEMGFGSQQTFLIPKNGDLTWQPLNISVSIKPHGLIPQTRETHEFVELIINGSMALHMMDLDQIELYNEILKHLVPSCYNIWNLIENIHGSIKRVKNPNCAVISKQLKFKKKEPSKSRKATPADFGIIVPKKNGRK